MSLLFKKYVCYLVHYRDGCHRLLLGDSTFDKQSVLGKKLFEHMTVLCRVCHIFSYCLIKYFIEMELFTLGTHSLWVSAEGEQVPSELFQVTLSLPMSSWLLLVLLWIWFFKLSLFCSNHPDRIPVCIFKLAFAQNSIIIPLFTYFNFNKSI